MARGRGSGPSRVSDPAEGCECRGRRSTQPSSEHPTVPARPLTLPRMCRRLANAGAAALAILVLVQVTETRPSGAVLSRPKRVSDQRLAEIETWLALSKMKGKLVTVPVGFGKVDPARVGRRRRSSTESNFQELRRILRSVVEKNAELSLKDRTRYARLFSSRWDEKEQDQASGDRDSDDSLY